MARRFVWPAFVGLVFGLIELARLKAGNYSPSLRQLAEILGIHAALGLVIGLPFVIVASLAMRLLSREEAPGRRQRPLPWRLAALTPAFATLFVMGGIAVNVLYLPARLSPVSLAADLVMLLVVAAAGLAWAHRPWGRSTDAVLVGLVAMAAAGIALWACLPPAGGGRPQPRRAGAADRPPDIFIVLLDTLRADHLASYGYGRVTSPRIDALAADGFVFERAYSTSNWTRPAVASLFTSTMPSRHGAVEVNRRISPSLPLLAEVLSARGMAVGFFAIGTNVEPSDGYDRGVDYFHTQGSRPLTTTTLFVRHVVQPLYPGHRRWLQGYRSPAARPPGPEDLSREALDWVGRIPRERPVFVYLHFAGPHLPYSPPDPFGPAFGGKSAVQRFAIPPASWAGEAALDEPDRQQMINQYDGEILWHDRQIGLLVDELRELGRLDRAVFVVTSDHGEGFGEHGVWRHTAGLFGEVARIPLIFWSTLDWGAPRRLGVNASLLDLAPTLADAAGAEVPASFDGTSLLPWLEGRRNDGRMVFAENPKNDEMLVDDGEWTYFEGVTGDGFQRWLYRRDDPAQRENLADRFPGVAERLHQLVVERREMDRSRATEAPTMELDEDRIEKLKALGYLQ